MLFLVFVLGVSNHAALTVQFKKIFLLDLLPIQIRKSLFDVFESSANFQVTLDSQIRRTCQFLLVKLLHFSN